MPTTQLVFVPQPKQVSPMEGSFALTTSTVIALAPGSSAVDFQSASQLQQEINTATGLELAILRIQELPAHTRAIVLSPDLDSLASFLGHDWHSAAFTAHGEQAYGLEVGADMTVVCGNSSDGLYYAVQTLRQVTRTQRASWPALRIDDWPSLPNRGLMLDVSRGKVASVDTIKLLIDQLAQYKMNVLQFYTEHTFAFAHHPRIGQDCGSLTSADIMELDAYAHAHHVQLMPNLQSFGHCEHILNLPEYTPLAESAAHWSLCPVDERTYSFIDDLYSDLLPSFSSKILNIGCDETFDLGKGRSKQRVEELGLGRVYLGHILRLREIAARYGCRIQLWGDILLHYPELVSELPEDVILLDWHYEAADDYPSTRIFGASGRPYWVCPGTSSWNTLFPRIENANGNIRTLARIGAENGASGFLNTDWGDGGHYQPIGQCWYGYIFGAEQAWTGGQTGDALFDASFGPLFFGKTGNQAVTALRALGKLNILPGMAKPNASQSIFALLDEPLVGPVAEQLSPETLETMIAETTRIEKELLSAYGDSSDPKSVEEILYTTRLLNYTARKMRASQDARQSLANLPAAKDAALSSLKQINGSLAACEQELPAFIETFRSLWLERARYSEIRVTLNHFAKLRARYAAAREWIAGRIADVESGKNLDGSLEGYAQEAASYEILYQGWVRHLREIGILWD